MEDFIEAIASFMEAQNKAEEEGRQEFTCPLCGGSAIWARSPHNNHLWCGCKICGIRMME